MYPQSIVYGYKITRKELENVVKDVCARNEPLIQSEIGEDFSYLIEATPREYGVNGLPLPPPEEKGKSTLLVRYIFLNMKSRAERFGERRGIHLVIPSSRTLSPQVMDTKIKTHSRHFLTFALHETHLVNPKGHPLFLDIDGNITETNLTNIFIVYKEESMPPTDRHILEGNGQANVFRVA